MCTLREASRPLQPSLKLPVANSRPRSSSSQPTNFTKTWQKAQHSQPKRSSALGLLFHTVLSQRTVADFTPTSCRLSLLLSVKLEAFSTLDYQRTKGCAGKLSSNTKLRTWMPLREPSAHLRCAIPTTPALRSFPSLSGSHP